MAEAQRLIAVSLGKIAQSRGQRGGASLYKNLLVSTVLHKARHAFMTENFAAMMQARKAQQAEREKLKEEEMVERPPRPQTPAPSVLASSNNNTSSSTTSMLKKSDENKENSRPVMEVQQVINNNKKDVVTSSPEEPSKQEQQQQEKEKSCAKCTKRRLADVQPQSITNNNNNVLCESSPNKRPKHDNESSYDKYDTSKVVLEEVSSSPSHEPMQTEQISNLVSRFNSGLSGLLGSSLNSNENSTCQKSSSDSIVATTCGATRATTFSDSIGSRPVIALTV